MTAEGNDLRTKSFFFFSQKKTLYLSWALCWVEKYLYLLYEVLVCSLGVGLGLRKGQFVSYDLLGLHFVYLLIIYVFIGFYLCLSGSL